MVESAWSKATTDRTGTSRGGTIEADESPAAGCEREIREELGLDLTVGRLLCVGWVQEQHDEHGALQFIYDGGVLDATTIGRIVLTADELTDHQFVTVDAAASLVSKRNLDRLRAALNAIANGGVAELNSTAPRPDERDHTRMVGHGDWLRATSRVVARRGVSVTCETSTLFAIPPATARQRVPLLRPSPAGHPDPAQHGRIGQPGHNAQLSDWDRCHHDAAAALPRTPALS